MPIGLSQHRIGSIFLMYPLELLGYDLTGLIPGYSLILALPSILGIPFPVGIPVHSFQRIFYPIRGIGSLFVGKE
jgi:hypothetical protein